MSTTTDIQNNALVNWDYRTTQLGNWYRKSSKEYLYYILFLSATAAFFILKGAKSFHVSLPKFIQREALQIKNWEVRLVLFSISLLIFTVLLILQISKLELMCAQISKAIVDKSKLEKLFIAIKNGYKEMGREFAHSRRCFRKEVGSYKQILNEVNQQLRALQVSQATTMQAQKKPIRLKRTGKKLIKVRPLLKGRKKSKHFLVFDRNGFSLNLPQQSGNKDVVILAANKAYDAVINRLTSELSRGQNGLESLRKKVQLLEENSKQQEETIKEQQEQIIDLNFKVAKIAEENVQLKKKLDDCEELQESMQEESWYQERELEDALVKLEEERTGLDLGCGGPQKLNSEKQDSTLAISNYDDD